MSYTPKSVLGEFEHPEDTSGNFKNHMSHCTSHIPGSIRVHLF